VSISADDLRRRQAAFAGRLTRAGLDGALVVSRGGGTFDRLGDVLYLTGHYQPFVYLPEMTPRWSGRSHTVFVLASSGANVLCVSVPGEHGHGVLAADDVRCSGTFTTTVVQAARDLGLDRAAVGIVGLDALAADLWDQLRAGLPDVRFDRADELLAGLRRIKSPAEQELIEAASAMGRRAVSAFLGTVEPGATEAGAAAAAISSVAADGGGTYLVTVSSGPFTWSFTTDPLPGWSTRVLERGELVRFDLVSVLRGYFSDFGRTVTVGDPTPEQARLIGVLHRGLDAAIAAVGPGVPAKAVVAAGDTALRDDGVVLEPGEEGTLRGAYPPHWGHGLGLGWERPWMIDSEEIVIEPGMYLAIERAVELEGVGTACAEQNMLVTESGVRLLTEGPNGRWS
jgi:Xaa-Pro aminopeptidase